MEMLYMRLALVLIAAIGVIFLMLDSNKLFGSEKLKPARYKSEINEGTRK